MQQKSENQQAHALYYVENYIILCMYILTLRCGYYRDTKGAIVTTKKSYGKKIRM